jgi:RNA polymerase sigma-70 factor (ECF subfamily)
VSESPLTANLAMREDAPRRTLSATAISAAERRAFEVIVEPMMPGLLRYFARRVTPRHDAADCLSETLLVLWRHRHKMPEQASEQRAWAYGIARQIWANHERKRVRRNAIGYGFAVRAQLASEPAPASPAAEAALTALESLSKTDRELIRLVIWDGFGVGEAGKVLGLLEATARSRYSRAKARIRTQLAQ